MTTETSNRNGVVTLKVNFMYDNGFVRRYMNLDFDYLVVYYLKNKKMKKINHIDNTF